MKNQSALREQSKNSFMKMKALLPELGKKFDVYFAEVYKEGALDEKTKRLMALTGALVSGSWACILAQTDRALEYGANVQEILEACAVAMSLGGTMAAGESTRVIQYLEELEMIS